MNEEIIKHLRDDHIKAREMTLGNETYVVGELRGQRFSIKFLNNEYRLYGGFSAVTMFDSSSHLSDVGIMVKNWAV